MTTQEAYQRMVDYFSRPGATLGWDDEQSLCTYRSGSRVCAVGALLPKKLYDEAMEGKTVDSLVRQFEAVNELFSGVDVNFLVSAQIAHDDVAAVDGPDQVEKFLTNLHYIATVQYGLKAA